MAAGSDLRHVCTFAAAIICGAACTEIAGQVEAAQGAEASCLVFAVAVLMCGITALAGQPSAVGSKLPAALCPEQPPCAKGQEAGRGAGRAREGADGGEGPASPESPGPSLAKEAQTWQGACSQALNRYFSCCSVRDSGDADIVPLHVAPLPQVGCADLPQVGCADAGLPSAQDAAGELRARLADILGAPGMGGADAEAAAAVERYGGERSCMARFLRARKGSAAAAERMFRATVEWRRSTGASHILSDPGARKVWDAVRPLYAASPVMFTAEGNLVVYFKMAEFLRIWKSGIGEEELRTFYISWMENMLALQDEGRSRLGHGPDREMPACIEVYDLQGVGLRHLRCLPGLRMMMRILKLGQDHYPENLHTAIFLNVPTIANTPLNMVRRVLDVRTQAKLRFTWDSGHSLLGRILKVGPEELLKRFHTTPGTKLLKEMALG